MINPPKNPNAYFSSFEEYKKVYDYSIKNPEKFWEEQAKENLTFFKDFSQVLDESEYPKCKWFIDGKINICYEAVDKYLEKNAEKIAIIFETENGDSEKITYKELSKNVNKSANLLKKMGVKKGDKVIFYMPQILESVYLMLACLRIGAIHSIVFSGFSASSVKDRIEDLRPKIIITADKTYRKNKDYLLKNIVDEALESSNFKPEKVLVVERKNSSEDEKIPLAPFTKGGTIFETSFKKEETVFEIPEINYNEEIKNQSEICNLELMDSEDISFILYTSGSTGKPKGIIHTTAGYALQTKLTSKWIFDMQENDIFFSSADIGWITGHSYTVYGPLLNGITTVLFEGNPLFPKPDRIWDLIEKYKINTFYTAPTLIRILHKTGKDLPKNFDLSSLKILGTVGEPIDLDSWNWFYEVVGNKKCAICDTYWQTETGAHILSPLPFATPLKQKSATFPFPGISGEIVDENGEVSKKGFFTITKPWPAMLRGVWGDDKKFEENYFSEIFRDGKALYFSGDGAYRDEDDYIFITGRIDDIVNVSGHRIGIAEVESSVQELEKIAECSIVGIPDELTGESLFGFVVLSGNAEIDKESLKKQINLQLRTEIGAFASLKNLATVSGLPKTRSGKIMRRILRTLAKGEEIKSDISTIENKEVIEEIKKSLYLI